MVRVMVVVVLVSSSLNGFFQAKLGSTVQTSE